MCLENMFLWSHRCHSILSTLLSAFPSGFGDAGVAAAPRRCGGGFIRGKQTEKCLDPAMDLHRKSHQRCPGITASSALCLLVCCSDAASMPHVQPQSTMTGRSERDRFTSRPVSPLRSVYSRAALVRVFASLYATRVFTVSM